MTGYRGGMRTIIVHLMLVLLMVPPASAQGYYFPKIEENPILRECGGPLLDPDGTMTAAEKAEAQRQVAACAKAYRDRQPKYEPPATGLPFQLPQPGMDSVKQRHQELLDAIRSLRRD
jgi:hypothetical protein